VEAIQLGATLVARSFSGDKRQLAAILKAAIAHRGLTIIDVISPCVTFNDHEGSTKSYTYMKEHDVALHELDFVPAHADISIEMAEGEVREIELHDGSILRLKKLGSDYDPTDRQNALRTLNEGAAKGEVITGVLYLDRTRKHFLDLLNLDDEPLATLPESRTRPPKAALEEIMEELR
jgi:2-oxoglutarate ferredoxin oxidoreductase subunit beta